VHFSAVEALVKLNKIDEALAILDKLTAAPGTDAMTRSKAIIRKTEILMQANKFSDVAAFVDGQKKLDPDTRLAVMLLKAKALEALKKDDAAWDIYLSIVKEYPDYPETYCAMAQLRYTQNNLQGAASLFMDCFNKEKKGPSAEDALYNAFLMYQKSGLKDKAIEVAGSYRGQYPQGRWSYDLTLAWANLYTKDQKYDLAEEVLKPWIEKTTDLHWPQVLFQMGYNLQLSGKNAEALLAYEKLANQSIPVELKYFVLKNSAVIYLKQNDQDKAAQALNWIIQNFPPSNLPLKDYLWLAQYWQAKNEPQKMLDILVQAQKIQAGAPEALGVTFFMAEAYRLQNNCAQAEGQYDQLIADKAKNVYQGRAYLGRGLCLASQGDKVNARKEFEEAIALNLEDNFVTMRARFELAGINEAQQDLKQAAKLYMMVGILYKDAEYGPRALLQAGVILQKLNENQAALKAYQQILEDYPHSEQALKAKELIGKPS
jgi:tetratricopeptide (TPR) repeat protein